MPHKDKKQTMLVCSAQQSGPEGTGNSAVPSTGRDVPVHVIGTAGARDGELTSHFAGPACQSTAQDIKRSLDSISIVAMT